MVDRFLIIGQPRSGTTLLQTLMNSHPGIHCRGELFDPWQIDDDGHKTTEMAAIRDRDARPRVFLEDMLSDQAAASRGVDWIGAKLLFQHNPRLFSRIIPAHPRWRLIYVTRPNKLAQFSSAVQVSRTNRWVDLDGTAQPPKIKPDPRHASGECNRLENEDYFLRHWFDTLPNPRLVVTYPMLARGEAAATVLSFLGLDPAVPLSTPLHRQGQPRVIDRFENAEDIAAHFTATNRAAWLEGETG